MSPGRKVAAARGGAGGGEVPAKDELRHQPGDLLGRCVRMTPPDARFGERSDVGAHRVGDAKSLSRRDRP
jgi:hypothetical protein